MHDRNYASKEQTDMQATAPSPETSISFFTDISTCAEKLLSESSCTTPEYLQHPGETKGKLLELTSLSCRSMVAGKSCSSSTICS